MTTHGCCVLGAACGAGHPNVSIALPKLQQPKCISGSHPKSWKLRKCSCVTMMSCTPITLSKYVSIYISIFTYRMKPADLNIYGCIICAVCYHSPEVEQDPECSGGVSWSFGEHEVLGPHPQPLMDFLGLQFRLQLAWPKFPSSAALNWASHMCLAHRWLELWKKQFSCLILR